MLRQSNPVKVGEEDFEIVVNVGSMIDIENLTGKGFMELAKETETGSIVALAQMLSCCLVKDGNSVGMAYIRTMEFELFGELFDPLIDAVMNAFPADKKKEPTVK